MANKFLDKSTTVYWTYVGTHQIRAEEPKSVFQAYFKGKNSEEYQYIRCPALRETLKNTFGLKSLFDYSIQFVDGSITSNNYSQSFFDKMVLLRDFNSRQASFKHFYVFIAEDDSLIMEYNPTILENNSFSKSAMLIPGTIDVGKYVRNLDMAFHCREDEMNIEEDDIYAYVKFRTDKKVEFKRFLWNDKYEEIVDQTAFLISERKHNFKPLDWFYKKQRVINTKRRILEVVKNQLLD